MSVYKRGSTVKILMELTQTEWETVYPFDAVKCEAEVPKLAPEVGETEYLFTVTPDPATKTMMLRSVSSDTWPIGAYRLDVRFTKNGENFFYPEGTDFINFSITKPVTDDE